MTNLHRRSTQVEPIVRHRAIAATALLTAGSAPLLLALLLMGGSHLLYWKLPVLAIVLLVAAGVHVWRSRTAAPSVAAGLILLLVIVAPFVAELIEGDDDARFGLLFALPFGCVGLAGCVAAWHWLRHGGNGWFGALGWVGGCVNLAGAAFCLAADTSLGAGNDGWDALGYVLFGCLCALAGCLPMLIGGIAMTVSVRRSRASGQQRRSAGVEAAPSFVGAG